MLRYSVLFLLLQLNKLHFNALCSCAMTVVPLVIKWTNSDNAKTRCQSHHLLEFATVAFSNSSMASSSSPRPLEPVADLPSSCSPASHHPLKFITGKASSSLYLCRVCKCVVIALILAHSLVLYCDLVGWATDVGLTVSHAESKVSPCQQADGSPSADVLEPEVTLPEVWCNCN
jgi:hypothetical protein